MSDTHKTVVIIPTFNEKKNIAVLAAKIFDLYPGISVLVVDDNSPDGTGQTVKEMQAGQPNLHLLERTGNRGLGRSYIDGFKKIINDGRYDYVVMMDADFSHDPGRIGAMAGMLEKYPAVVGSRYVSGGKIENWNWRRRILSRFANFYATKILGLPVKDGTTGFMGFRKNVLNQINLDGIRSDGYAFLVELKYRFYKVGLAMYEYPIIFSERREGESKMSFKIIWESVWLPWKLKFIN